MERSNFVVADECNSIPSLSHEGVVTGASTPMPRRRCSASAADEPLPFGMAQGHVWPSLGIALTAVFGCCREGSTDMSRWAPRDCSLGTQSSTF